MIVSTESALRYLRVLIVLVSLGVLSSCGSENDQRSAEERYEAYLQENETLVEEEEFPDVYGGLGQNREQQNEAPQAPVFEPDMVVASESSLGAKDSKGASKPTQKFTKEPRSDFDRLSKSTPLVSPKEIADDARLLVRNRSVSEEPVPDVYAKVGSSGTDESLMTRIAAAAGLLYTAGEFFDELSGFSAEVFRGDNGDLKVAIADPAANSALTLDQFRQQQAQATGLVDELDKETSSSGGGSSGGGSSGGGSSSGGSSNASGNFVGDSADDTRLGAVVENDFTEPTVSVIGSGLGGNLAEFAALSTGTTATVFDSPGLTLQQRRLFLSDDSPSITRVNSGKDFWKSIISTRPSSLNDWLNEEAWQISLPDGNDRGWFGNLVDSAYALVATAFASVAAIFNEEFALDFLQAAGVIDNNGFVTDATLLALSEHFAYLAELESRGFEFSQDGTIKQEELESTYNPFE